VKPALAIRAIDASRLLSVTNQQPNLFEFTQFLLDCTQREACFPRNGASETVGGGFGRGWKKNAAQDLSAHIGEEKMQNGMSRRGHKPT